MSENRIDVGYLRVSTEAQTEKYGLEVQENAIKKLAEKNGTVIKKWYVDGGFSGAKLNRPDMQNLLTDVELGLVRNVYIYKLDRMSRDVIDTLTLLYRVLLKYGVNIISATEELRFETPMDKVSIGFNALMNQYEREVIFMRTRAGMVERVKRGLWMGGGRVPYGYRYDRNDGILHIVPEEAKKVVKVFEMYIDGYSDERIYQILGLKCEGLARAIRQRKTYCGYIPYKGQTYKGLHEPIIDEDTFDEAQYEAKRRVRGFIVNTNQLTNLCVCGRCGGRLRYQKWSTGHRLLCYARYKGDSKLYLRKVDSCDMPPIETTAIEEAVADNFKQFAISIKDNYAKKTNDELVKAELEKTRTQLTKLYGLYADNDSESLLEAIRLKEIRLTELKAELENIYKEKSREPRLKAEEITRIADVWESLSNEDKNKVYKETVDKVVINYDDENDEPIVDVFFKIF